MAGAGMAVENVWNSIGHRPANVLELKPRKPIVGAAGKEND
ncbi:hypothetical protein [Pseudorhodobacter wandonensis]|jgi:hypothetical protein|nr:hypothetical protein [Pseudorhodobacter wandonensis]